MKGTCLHAFFKDFHAWLISYFLLTLRISCIKNCIKIKMNLKIYLYSSLWCLKSEAPQRSVKKKFKLVFSFCSSSWRQEWNVEQIKQKQCSKGIVRNAHMKGNGKTLNLVFGSICILYTLKLLFIHQQTKLDE